MLSALPFLIRLVQSIRRYCDSGLITHLINVGASVPSFVRVDGDQADIGME